MLVHCAKNYYQNILMSEHTVTYHSQYNYLNKHHSVTLISWKLYIIKLSPVIKTSLCSRQFLYQIWRSHNLQVVGYCTIAALLPHFPLSKQFTLKLVITLTHFTVVWNLCLNSLPTLYFLGMCLCPVTLWQLSVFYSFLVLYLRTHSILKRYISERMQTLCGD
jgi:hypothetical protein